MPAAACNTGEPQPGGGSVMNYVIRKGGRGHLNHYNMAQIHTMHACIPMATNKWTLSIVNG